MPGPLEREFKPIDDIHIGIVTSSLGGHGADTCSPAIQRVRPRARRQGQLLPSVRTGIPQYSNTGFLVWDPSGKHNPPGEGNRADPGYELPARRSRGPVKSAAVSRHRSKLGTAS